MADTNSTTTTDYKTTPNYVASEIWDINKGFAILHEMHHSLMSMKDIDSDTLDQLLWMSCRIDEALVEVLKHAEEAAGIERREAPLESATPFRGPDAAASGRRSAFDVAG